MYWSLLAILSVASALALPPVTKERRQAAPSYAFPGDPPYGVDPQELSSVLTCPKGNPTSAASKPVLLVHGTGSTGSETWGFGYVPALAAAGFTPCYITIPERSMGDMQVSSSYIAYNLHAVSSMVGGAPVAVMAHSQGNPNIQWALHFFPSTQSITSMFVGLSPDFYGAWFNILSGICSFDGDSLCAPSLWQQASGSHYHAALDAKGLVAQVPTTLIWSETDEVVVPPEQNAQMAGATSIPVQDLCPGRLTDHLSMVIDAAGFALATDALNNGGKADLDRVRGSSLVSCVEVAASNMDPTVPQSIQSGLDAVAKGIFGNGIEVTSEPPIMQYAINANQGS